MEDEARMMVWSEGEGGKPPVTVTVPDAGALLSEMGDRLDRGEGFAVATLNLDHAVKLGRDPAFRAAYGAHTHVTADGRPIVWLSRLAGQKVTLVPGSGMVEPVAGLAAEKAAPVAFFGGAQDTLDVAAERLSARHSGLDVVLRLSPPMGFDPAGPAADEAIAAIRNSGARLVFVALGAPKQEIFAARALAALPGVGFFSIGAGLDFIAGVQKRAPKWVQAIAAEWLWRLIRDPGRLAARYGACIVALPGLTRTALRARGRT